MRYVHYCAGCGRHDVVPTPTLLDRRCAGCGAPLATVAAERWPQRRAELERARPAPAPLRTSWRILLAIGLAPFAFYLLGRGDELVFLAPAALCLVTAYYCLRAGRTWLLFAIASLIAAGSSLLVVVSALAGAGDRAGLYLGGAASVALALAGWDRLRLVAPAAQVGRLVDGALWATVATAPVAWFVVGDALQHGDATLAAVVALDLVGAFAAIVAVNATVDRTDRRIARAVAAGFALVAAGDIYAFLGSAGQVGGGAWVVALLWSSALLLWAHASRSASVRQAEPVEPAEPSSGDLLREAVIPFAAVFLLACEAVVIWAFSGSSPAPLIVFGALFLVGLAAVCIRQAALEGRMRDAVYAERALREQSDRRRQDLEALTALAGAMTGSLEEEPIVERGLAALELASGALGAELRFVGEEEPRAVLGDPQSAGTELVLGLDVRTSSIGSLRLVRDAARPFTTDERDLLGVLASQLAVAVANARAYREKLDESIRDPLTGVYNRRFFDDALDRELERSARTGEPIAVALFDLDDFKSINDSLGHAAGDEVLCRAAQALLPLVRGMDVFCRLGGEEFGLILPATGQLDALLVAERLRAAVARTDLAAERRVTVSGGIACWPDDALGREELLARADSALHWAKTNGKNLCAVASEVTAGDAGEPHALMTNLYSLVAATDGRDLHTRDHSENVATYAVAIAQELGLDHERVHALRRAAFLHDIGKIVVPRHILEKPGRPDPEEWAALQLHPAVGATMLEHAGLAREAEWVRHHHERMDGKGYPDNLAGEAIPLESRIIFVADSFEAMTSDRPYRAGMPPHDALAELCRCTGTQFDPQVVAALLRLRSENKLVVLALRPGEHGPTLAPPSAR